MLITSEKCLKPANFRAFGGFFLKKLAFEYKMVLLCLFLASFSFLSLGVIFCAQVTKTPLHGMMKRSLKLCLYMCRLPGKSGNSLFHFLYGGGKPRENGARDERVPNVQLCKVGHGVKLCQVGDLDAVAGVYLKP